MWLQYPKNRLILSNKKTTKSTLIYCFISVHFVLIEFFFKHPNMIDLSNFSEGVYIIQLNIDNEIIKKINIVK